MCYVTEVKQIMEKKKRERGKGNAGRCTKKSSKARYSKKRVYHGKRKKKDGEDVVLFEVEPVECVQEQDEPDPEETASSRNVVDINIQNTSLGDIPREIEMYCLMDLSLLARAFTSLYCPVCHGQSSLNMNDLPEKKIGLARTLKITCRFCPYHYEFCTSKKVNPPSFNKTDDKKEEGSRRGGSRENAGRKSMAVNIRMVYGCRAIEVGYQPMKKLCCYLNMPPPMSSSNYDKISNSLKDAAKHVAEKSMDEAGKDLLRLGDESVDTGVFVDGTWQRKGFSSTLGVVSAISADSGKVLDVCVMPKTCKGCTRMKGVEKTDPRRFHAWEKVSCL